MSGAVGEAGWGGLVEAWRGEGGTRWKRAEPVGARGDACGEGLEFLGIRAMSAASQHARERYTRYNYWQAIVRLRSSPTRRTQRPRTVVTDFVQAQVALAGPFATASDSVCVLDISASSPASPSSFDDWLLNRPPQLRGHCWVTAAAYTLPSLAASAALLDIIHTYSFPLHPAMYLKTSNRNRCYAVRMYVLDTKHMHRGDRRRMLNLNLTPSIQSPRA